MSYHIRNKLTIQGPSSEQALSDFIVEDEHIARVGFDKLLPSAKSYPDFFDTEEFYKRFGFEGNAYMYEIHGTFLLFCTQKNSADKLIQFSSKRFPDCVYILDFAGEEKGIYAGHIEFQNGEISNMVLYGDESREACELYDELWGISSNALTLTPGITFMHKQELFTVVCFAAGKNHNLSLLLSLNKRSFVVVRDILSTNTGEYSWNTHCSFQDVHDAILYFDKCAKSLKL